MSGASKDKDGLTDKMKAYARGRAQGKTKTDAYMEAYDTKTTRKKAYQQARELETEKKASPTLALYIERLRRQYEAGQVLKGQEIAAALSEMAADETAPRGERLAAMDKLLRMQGAYTERHEIAAAVSMQAVESAALDAIKGLNPYE